MLVIRFEIEDYIYMCRYLSSEFLSKSELLSFISKTLRD